MRFSIARVAASRWVVTSSTTPSHTHGSSWVKCNDRLRCEPAGQITTGTSASGVATRLSARLDTQLGGRMIERCTA